MAEKKCDVEICLESIEVDAKTLKDADAKRLFQCNLIWPKIGTAMRSSSLAVVLDKGKWSSEGRPWHECIVTKDSIQGRIGIAVGLTGKITDGLASLFSRTAGASAVKLLAGLVGDAASGLPGDILSLPISAATKVISKEKEPEMLYKATIDFDTAALPAAGGTMRLEFPLQATGDIAVIANVPSPRQTRAKRTRLAKKGERIGVCTIAVTVL